MGSQRASSSNDEKLSRRDRKFQKKLEFYSMVRENVASLNAKKTITKKKKLRSRQRKLKVYDLSSIKESLPELKAPREATTSHGGNKSGGKTKLSWKERREILEQERQRFMEVINNPEFKEDYVGFLYRHVLSTVPVEEPEEKSSKTEKKGKGKKTKGLV